eukprot:CAMPEP_0197539630 /NCGR_PEP_ID=MMETSP1318-20131121/63339_1 /TAXON_ID=552666 /ORGANISM="Partenskyella glossopodia, Strain RCC365" /LENGTH=577 /DNA_ID=CAMNT_0043098391 /DNA_START=51 /DNA_END=1784 /DNA_ORIENTATION=-
MARPVSLDNIRDSIVKIDIPENELEDLNAKKTSLPKIGFSIDSATSDALYEEHWGTIQYRLFFGEVFEMDECMFALLGVICLHITLSVLVSTLNDPLDCDRHNHYVVETLAGTCLGLSALSALELALQFFIYQGAFIMSFTFMSDVCLLAILIPLQALYFAEWRQDISQKLFAIALFRLSRVIGLLNSRYKHMLGEKNKDAAMLVETTGEAFRLRRIIKNLKYENSEMKQQLRGHNDSSLVTHSKSVEGYLKIKNEKGLLSTFLWHERFFKLDRQQIKPVLSFWTNSAQAILETPQGVVDMTRVNEIRTNVKNKKRFEIVVRDGGLLTFGFRTKSEVRGGSETIAFELYAKSEKDADMWVTNLRYVIAKLRDERVDSPVSVPEDAQSKNNSLKKQHIRMNTEQLSDAILNPIGKSLTTLKSHLVPKEALEIQSRDAKMSKLETISIIESMHRRRSKSKTRNAQSISLRGQNSSARDLKLYSTALDHSVNDDSETGLVRCKSDPARIRTKPTKRISVNLIRKAKEREIQDTDNVLDSVKERAEVEDIDRDALDASSGQHDDVKAHSNHQAVAQQETKT